MKIWLVVTGKTDATWLQQGIDVYLKRIGHYLPFELKVLPDLKNMASLPPPARKEKEGEALLAFLGNRNEVYLLDEKGEEMTSRQLAALVERKMTGGCRELVFVIGGPFGFSEEAAAKASGKISLSRLTFSHQMVRLLFAEQLYRALTIIRGEPYHHD